MIKYTYTNMKASLILFSFILTISLPALTQDKVDEEKTMSQLPYYEIPDSPAEYTAENVAARMVDGLGFRYYWATEGLREEDLSYKPSKEARTALETIDHIYGLTEVLLNAVKKLPNIRTTDAEEEDYSFDELRSKTLSNIKAASEILKNSEPESLENYPMVFQRDESSSEFPFWNLINGPIADAIWHAGQVVSLRRASGNPFNSNASLLRGKLRK